MKKIYTKQLSLLLLVLAVAATFSCRKEVYVTKTTDDVNLTEYLERNSDRFSLLSEMIQRSGAKGYLGAYGKYTLFAPTNDAVKKWLTSINKSSLSEVSDSLIKATLGFHLIMDTLGTRNFNDGKISLPSVAGQYLQTSVSNEGGVSSYVINKQAKITLGNVITGNGFLHEIDKVLIEQPKTVAEMIAENPRYSIFTQALKATGFYDSLDVKRSDAGTDRKFQTVFAESDSTLKAAGYASFEELQTKLSTKNNPKDHADSLWIFVAYHVVSDANYLADIIKAPSISTRIDGEVITPSFGSKGLVLNEVEIGNEIEPGAPINRSYSDQQANNGVIHDVASNIRIKVRVPIAVYWDIAQMAGVKTNPSYGQAAFGIDASNTTVFSDLLMEKQNATTKPQYKFGNTVDSRTYANRDVINFSMVSPTGSGAAQRQQWIRLRTPLLIKGQYKVWVCYGTATGNTANTEQVTMNPGTDNEQVFPNLLNTAVGFIDGSGVANGTVDAESKREEKGFKSYIATTSDVAVVNGQTVKGTVSASYNTSAGRLMGIANIKTTDRQWIEFKCISGGNNENLRMDMIHFIPVGKDQLYPKFSPDGVQFPRP